MNVLDPVKNQKLFKCSEEFDVIPLGKNFYPLAEECYNALNEIGLDAHTPQKCQSMDKSFKSINHPVM